MRPLGMALFPFVLIKEKPRKTLLNHEAIHLRQQMELGILPFYVWYLIEYAIRRIKFGNHYLAYRNISFEREAFANEKDTKYLRRRQYWQFLKYL